MKVYGGGPPFSFTAFSCMNRRVSLRAKRFLQKNASPPCTETMIYDILCAVPANGEVAQLVEHHVRNVGVESSNLFFSTIRQGTRQAAFVHFWTRRDFFRFGFARSTEVIRVKRTRFATGEGIADATTATDR